MGLRNVCTRYFKYHYGGSFTSYIMIFGFIYGNGPTNVRKSDKGVLVPVPFRAPSLCPGGGRGVTEEATSDCLLLFQEIGPLESIKT